MSDGRPLTDPAHAASLLTSDGAFPRFPDSIGELDPAEVRREWRAQIAAFQACGLEPTHIDTHHHAHSNPRVFQVYCDIASTYGLPARTLSPEMTSDLRARGVRCADLSAVWNGESQESLLETVCALLDSARGGQRIVEIVCHPGRLEPALEKASLYVSGRATELEALCVPELARILAVKDIELVSMAALRDISV